MKTIKEFSSYEELKKFIKGNAISELGAASEGTVYLHRDGYAYKLFDYDHEFDPKIEIDEIITIDDINLDSFAFPIELYVVNGCVKGHKTKYVLKDFFSPACTCESLAFFDVDLDNFKIAYYKILKDVIELSNKNIAMFDLGANLMFDGISLIGIDTCYFRKVNYNPQEQNIDMLNTAIEYAFNFWLERTKNYKELLQIKENKIDEYLDNVNNMMIAECGTEGLLRRVLRPSL